MKKVEHSGNQVPLDQIVSDADLKDLSNNSDGLLVDRQTIRAMTYMNPNRKDGPVKN